MTHDLDLHTTDIPFPEMPYPDPTFLTCFSKKKLKLFQMAVKAYNDTMQEEILYIQPDKSQRNGFELRRKKGYGDLTLFWDMFDVIEKSL